MKELDVIRAWKDEEYRTTLTDAELLALPAHPSGIIELPESELGAVAGANTEDWSTIGCCQTIFLHCGLTIGWRTVGCCPTKIQEI